MLSHIWYTNIFDFGNNFSSNEFSTSYPVGDGIMIFIFGLCVVRGIWREFFEHA